jgi:hypothetical protein
MFIKRGYGFCHRLWETQAARDIGATGAARLDQVARDVGAVFQDRGDSTCACGQRLPTARAAEHKAQRGAKAFGNQFVIMFEAAIVREIDFGDPCGIAGTAQILEQRGIINRSPFSRGQAERLSDTTGDPATAQRMAFRLSLGQVERVREGGQDFAQRGRTAGGQVEVGGNAWRIWKGPESYEVLP